MEERLAFASEYTRGHESMAALCRKFGISRKTGYKWAERYLLEGPEGLRERTSRPRSNSRTVSEEIETYFVRLREKYRDWGPRKLRAFALELNPTVEFPAASTIGEILKRNGLTQRRRYRRTAPRDTDPFSECTSPNSVWCADYKGDFLVRQRRCYPLTIMDGFSRYLLECQALADTSFQKAQKVFRRAFYEHGLPAAIRTDNGTPFASRGAGGLSRLSVWWIRLRIKPERIDPGHPEQNGRHERMHRTLKKATASPPQPSFVRQQAAFDTFRREYNGLRPHEALGQIPPSRVYAPSTRPYPARLEELEYPANYEQRRVQDGGIIRWRGERVFLSSVLSGEVVGLEQTNYDQWTVHFGPVSLGLIDERKNPAKLIRPRGPRNKLKVSP